MIEALHFTANINESSIDCLLDSNFKVNVLPYTTTSALCLGIYFDVRDEAMVNIKGAPFCGCVPEVPVCIGGITVLQPFFISRRTSSRCTLGRPFEAATRMMRTTMDDGSVRMAIFNAQNMQDLVFFQPYTPGSAADCYGHELVWREPVEDD